MASTVVFRALPVILHVPGADALSQALEPVPGPGEFKTENCEANRDENERRTRSDDHYDSNDEDRQSNDRYYDSFRHFVGFSNRIHRLLMRAVGEWYKPAPIPFTLVFC